MADVQHSALTGASLHEPKGVAAASANTVYVADGAGSGAWEKIDEDAINTSSIKNVNKMYLTYEITTLNPAASYFMVVPVAATLEKIYSVIDGAITGANNVMTFEIGGTLVTNGTVTITQSGSAAGDVDEAIPTATNVLTAGQALEIISNGGASNDIKCTLSFVFDVG
jgi:hypothetical protein